MRELVSLALATPSDTPSLRWAVVSLETAASYGSFLISDLCFEYRAFGIFPRQA